VFSGEYSRGRKEDYENTKITKQTKVLDFRFYFSIVVKVTQLLSNGTILTLFWGLPALFQVSEINF
jgi:hypothetical protein